MIEIKQLKGQKKYQEVTKLMNKHIQKMSENIKEEEIWFLEHQNVFTAGSSTPKEFKIDKINNDVEVLATYKEEVVAVRQGKHIGISCHPELLNETLIHEICFKGKHEVS